MVKVYDETGFYKAFADDLKAARALVLIQSPFLREWRISTLEPVLRDCINRRVRICVFAQTEAMRDAKVVAGAKRLIEIGVHVSCRSGVHAKVIIIDEEILYDGSLNSFSHTTSSERMTRWEDRDMACQAMLMHELNLCDPCRSYGFNITESEDEVDHDRKLIGIIVRRRRKRLRLSQRELANKLGLHQSVLSKIESGTRIVNANLLILICRKLGLRLTPVPEYVTPTLDEITANGGMPQSSPSSKWEIHSRLIPLIGAAGEENG
ncbi:MAG TPA: helix-turn-helix domain-containing protein [Trichormus sp.]|jgi:transcriptional regulator with XRE-family HTH domain